MGLERPVRVEGAHLETYDRSDRGVLPHVVERSHGRQDVYPHHGESLPFPCVGTLSREKTAQVVSSFVFQPKIDGRLVPLDRRKVREVH